MTATSDKLILDESELVKFREKCREAGQKVVLVTGVFDILHIGHLKFLEKARALGDILIVGVNSDEYVRNNKGSSRPIQKEYDRAYLIAGFECVSCAHIYFFGNDFFQLLKPDILIMSSAGGRKIEDRAEHFEIIESNGGEVVIVDECAAVHSSEIIEKMNH